MREGALEKKRTRENDDIAVQNAQNAQNAPGKAPRTNRLGASGASEARPVQRKEDDAQPAGASRQAHEWMYDPAVMAAHGFAADAAAQPVQRKEEAEPEAEKKKGFGDLDATMYRVTMDGSERKVEQVARQVDDDGNVFYVALGRVTGFSGERPVVEPYDPPVNLGNWTPRITHVNGMMVTPEGGIGGAESLHESVASNLDESMMPPDVLYTYSAKGGFFPDLIDSVKGKLGIDDAVIESQATLILDAVHSGQRISVSAHSRGTIKTDVAIRNAHAVLRTEFASSLVSSPEADQAAEEATQMAQQMAANGSPTIAPAMAATIARRAAAKKLAGQRAWDAIEEHVQLIYAGNAVKFPAPPAELVVGRMDFVSMTVGTYFKLGRDIKRFEKISGGHGFDENYAATVGEWIAADMMAGSQ